MSVDEYRAASREQWERGATAWERQADRLDTGPPGVAAGWMLDAAALRPGERVLEVACGPAGVGLLAAERVGPSGTVLCTDFAAPMAEAAARRAAARGLGNVEARVLDAEAMDLPDAEFDAALCRFGYMLVAEPPRALAETLRVLRPGGRLALAVWAEPEANPWIGSLMGPVMEHFGAPPPDPDGPGMFRLADGDRLTALLEEAGFAEVRTERLEAVERHPSPEDWWDSVTELAGPVQGLLAAMDEEGRAGVRARAFELAGAFADGDGLAFPAAVRVASGSRPG